MGKCLNCGAPLVGKFCATCGQRAIPPYPSIREMAGEVWHEFSGWDGRFIRTFKALFTRPGALTVDVLEGRRARYISPVRLYLVASVTFFVISAAAPNRRVKDDSGRMREVQIGVWTSDDETALTAEDRAEMQREIDEAHWFTRPLFEAVLRDPAGLQSRMVAAMPKVFFALVPVFAGILSIFYWKRRYSQHLIFALHLHAVIFVAMAAAELPKFTGNVPTSMAAAAAALLLIVVYGLRGLRHAYGSRWPATLVKAAGIGLVYAAVSVLVLFLVIATIAFLQ